MQPPPLPTARLARLAANLLLAGGLAGCAGPELVLEEIGLAETGNPELPLRWEATIHNESRRSFPCFKREAKAKISVVVNLASDPGEEPAFSKPLGRRLVTDGGDPNLGRPDSIRAGDRQQISYLAPGVTLADLDQYPWIVFRIETTDVEDQPLENTFCSRWNASRTAAVAEVRRR